MKGEGKRGSREETETGVATSRVSCLSPLKCSFVPSYQDSERGREEKVTDNSYAALPPPLLRSWSSGYLRSLFPGGLWGLQWTGRFRTANPEKQSGFSLRLSGTCPFKGYKPSLSLDSPPGPQSLINYTMRGKKKPSGQLKIT